jgi:2-polyprenyl-3-methyl-5-hydroxy-6-metoxy-1,4-benzoquinol methylase
MGSENDRRDFYSRIAAQYDQCVVENVCYDAHLRVPKRVLELYGKPQAKVLDLGCGTGLSSVVFFDAGFEVTGLDYSPGMIEVASQRPYKELFCQSVEEEFPVPDFSFDIVTALGVTEFVEDPALFLKRIWQKLQPGGLCAMTIPKPTDAAQELGIKIYSLEEFMNFVDREQFDVIESSEFYGWESGHLSKIDGHSGNPHHRVDYCALFLRKRSG